MDSLSGIPGVGPSRKAALVAAGVTTRAALAQMSVEQLISLTGMPRAQAAAALDAVRKEESPQPALTAPADEAYPEAAGRPDTDPKADRLEATEEAATPETPVLPDEDQSPAVAARAVLDRAALRVKTALADATRVWSLPKLNRPLARLIVTLDGVTTELADTLRPKASRRLATRLDAVAAWIETEVAKEKPMTDKRRERLRERLRTDRQRVEEALTASHRRRADKNKPAGAASGKKQ